MAAPVNGQVRYSGTQRGTHQLEVHLHQRIQVALIATADHRHHRQAGTLTLRKNTAVAFVDPRQTDVEMAEFVIAVDIGAGIIDHRIGCKAFDGLSQGSTNALEIGVVGDAFRQAYVQVRDLLVKREVLFAVDGDGNDVIARLRQVSRTVALMHIAVKDQDPVDSRLVQQIQGAEVEVVDDAETGSDIAKRVVITAGQIDGTTALQRQTTGKNGTSH